MSWAWTFDRGKYRYEYDITNRPVHQPYRPPPVQGPATTFHSNSVKTSVSAPLITRVDPVPMMRPGQAASHRSCVLKICAVGLTALLPVVSWLISGSYGDNQVVITTVAVSSIPFAITVIALSVLKCRDCIHQNTYVPVDAPGALNP